MLYADFKTYFSSLSETRKQEVLDELLLILDKGSEFDTLNDKNLPCCPHCSSEKIRANGKTSYQAQKYYCNSCKKHYSDNSNKVWCYVKKQDEMKNYIYGLLSGYSLRKSAQLCGISLNTSFIWRHKLLRCFDNISAGEYEGILEVDEMFFPISEKGSRKMTKPSGQRRSRSKKRGISDEKVAVIATVDRAGNKGLQVSKLGQITKESVSSVLDNKIGKVKVICSDKHPSYASYTKEKGLVHKTIMASHGQRITEKVYHVQNVNNTDKRIRDFIRPMNGVATKYLQSYLNWFLMLEKIKNSKNKLVQLGSIILASNEALSNYKNGPILQNLLGT
jgi:transposase-like protein